MKRTNGITLIALIITIIVLLILAGVTLNFIRTGNIFGIAGISTEEYRKSQIKENIEVSILDTQLEKGREVTLDEIIDGLIEKGITTEEGSDRESGTVITEEGYIAGIIEKEEGGWEVVIGEKGEIQTSLTYEVIPSQLTSKVTVKIEGKILGEGIKELVLPNGEKKTYESGTKKINEEYEITANGTYTIKLIGNNGTEIEKEININNIVEGIISIVPSTNKPSKKITIEVTYPEGSDSLTKEISIDNGKSWNEYTGEIEITQNTTVQARLKNETEVIKAATLTISNIDTLSPNKFTPSATSTSNSITISGSTEDQEATETSASSGIAEYYFSKDNGVTWVSNAEKTGTSYTFTGLTQGTNYTLKMKAVDKAGNEIITEAITKATTSIAGEGSITITPSTTAWTNKDITITVTWPSDTSGLTKQISTDNGSTWKTYTGSVTISSNCTVKARLIDSTNQTGTSASLTISKIDKQAPTAPVITGGSTSYATSRTISVSTLPTEIGSGIAYYEYYLTSSSTAPTTATTATGKVGTTANDKSKVFNTNYAGYYVYYRAIDNATNKGAWSTAQRLYIDINKPTVTAKQSSVTIEQGASNSISGYFTTNQNGNAAITSTTYKEGSTTVSNTNTLSEGTHIITCTVTKANGLSASATITIVVEKSGMNSSEIASNSSEHFGGYVTNYTTPSGDPNVKWRIFYADESNVYLIASDYIHLDYAPESANNTLYDNRNGYQLSFDNVYKDYTGAANITDSRITKWINYVKDYPSATGEGIQSVAFMLDEPRWSAKYANPEYAEYAIGGPTLELWCASYKETHDRYVECSYNDTGYLVKWSDSTSSPSYNVSGAEDDKDLYYITDPDKCYYMWLASPSAMYSYNLMRVHYTDRVGSGSYNYNGNAGFRPLVCLKSGIQLEKQNDGTYLIK